MNEELLYKLSVRLIRCGTGRVIGTEMAETKAFEHKLSAHG